MNVIRPCLACGNENPAGAADCARCEQRLCVHAASAPAPARHAASTRRGTTSLLAGLLVLTGVGALVAWALGRGGGTTVQPLLDWSRPDAVAAWASAFLARADLPPEQVEARLVPDKPEPRRAFISRHPESQALPQLVKAVARLLLAARDEGVESGAHLAVLRHGHLSWTVPMGEARALAEDPAALARWLGLSEHELGLGAPVELAESGGAALAIVPSPDAAPALRAPEDVGMPDLPVLPAPATTEAAPSNVPARVGRGNGAVPVTAEAGRTAVPVFRLQVAAGARRWLSLKSLTVKSKGTLAEVDDITWVDLWREMDPSGRGGRKPERLGERQSFADEDGIVTFAGLDARFGTDGLPLALLVTVDFAADVAGGVLEVSLPDASLIVLHDDAGNPVPVIGAPVAGVRISVEANVERDPEQDRLDELAAAGPDAADPNVERMKQEAQEAAERERSAGTSAPR